MSDKQNKLRKYFTIVSSLQQHERYYSQQLLSNSQAVF